MFDDLEDLTFDKKLKPEYTNSKDVKKASGSTTTKKGSEPMFEVVEGVVNFSNITEHDTFNGQDTGAYSMTVTLSEDDAAQLEAKGVKIKDYNGAKQRKFKSRFDIKAFDEEGSPWSGEIPYNSRVRLKYKLGNKHPVHGVATYLDAVKVLEVAENQIPEDAAEF
jgi:hypothetical protein